MREEQHESSFAQMARLWTETYLREKETPSESPAIGEALIAASEALNELVVRMKAKLTDWQS